jgi:ribosomal protein L21E
MSEVKSWNKAVQQLSYNLGVDDPKKVILDALGDALNYLPNIYGSRVLVATAPSPNKRGSIWVPDKNKDEGRYQGKVGLVLGWGPNAFKFDPQFPSYPWEGPKPEIGDWVYYKTASAWEVGINGVSCRYVLDEFIVGDVVDIEVIF